MFCIKCGKENNNESKFCMHCGAAIPTSQLESNSIVTTNNEGVQGGKVIASNQKKGFYVVNWIVTFVMGLLFFAFPMLTEYVSSEENYLHIYGMPGSISYIYEREGGNVAGGGAAIFLTVGIMIIAVAMAISLIILYKNMINYNIKKILVWSKIYATINLITLGLMFIWDKVADNYSNMAEDSLHHKGTWIWLSKFDFTAFFWVAVVVAVVYRFFILTMYSKVVKKS